MFMKTKSVCSLLITLLVVKIARSKPAMNNPANLQLDVSEEGLLVSGIEAAFRSLDQNGDGNLTIEELENSMKRMGRYTRAATISNRLNKEDVDKNGPLVQEPIDPAVKDMFSVVDKDDNGFLSTEELKKIMPGRVVNEVMLQSDIDEDNHMNLFEFNMVFNSS